MTGVDRIRRQKIAVQAEGYLELGMARHALDLLNRFNDDERIPDQILYLKGEALRELGSFREAIVPLSRAANRNPANIHAWIALGWCHKRTGRIDLAIEALEEALSAEPDEALIHYNLACYWSLATNKRQALAFLARAIDLHEAYRQLVADEPDFDPLRSDPAFQALVRVTV